MSTLTRPRSVRRTASRVEARKHPLPPKPSSFGEVAELVHSRPRLPDARTGTTSGQRRINAKRVERGEFWRTVRVSVSPDLEPSFRQHLDLLGHGARIVGARPHSWMFGWGLDVHIPGAPADAVTAEPVWWSEYDGHGGHSIRLQHVEYRDAAGQSIETAELAGSAA